MFPISGNPIGYQQLTSISAATGLTIPSGATQVLIMAAVQIVRFRNDGSDPTSTVGFPLPVGNPFFFMGNLSKFKFIQATSGAILDVLYFK